MEGSGLIGDDGTKKESSESEVSCNVFEDLDPAQSFFTSDVFEAHNKIITVFTEEMYGPFFSGAAVAKRTD